MEFKGACGDQTERRKRVGQAVQEQGIALVLGAGVSMAAGAPSWNDLLGRLVLSVVHTKLEPGTFVSDAYRPFTEILGQALPTDPLVVAHYVKLALSQRGGADNERFLQTLRQALYARANPPAESPLLQQLADLCRGSSWQKSAGVKEVITYNYDVFLEEVLEQARCPYEAVRRHGRDSGTGLPVYHPHGVLHRQQHDDDWAVLSEDDYHSEFAAPHSWSNIVQLNAFSQMRCVFVGLSMTDTNIRRLLGAARTVGEPQHFAFLRRRDAKAALERLTKTRSWNVGNPGDKPEKLELRVRLACLGGDAADDLTLKALGIEVLWYDSHDELPLLLEALKQPSK
jgi:hypothetical protein